MVTTMRRGNRQLLSYSTEELVARWEEFLDEEDLSGRITKLADAYPEERSLHVDYGAIDRFDSDLAIYLLDHPQNAVYSVEQAIRSFVPPTGEAEIRFRVTGVPRDLRVEVRDLRAKHLGKLVSVEGLVRKATEVRPRLVEAVFQCLRCGAVIKEAQEGLEYHEPLECYEDQGGCGRTTGATKLKLLDESSRYIDTQKIEIQEPPEELRGGEAPQRLAGYLEEDLVGLVNPGDRIVFNGVLRGSQRGRFRSKSTLFDIFLNVVGLELEQVEYEEIEITPEDEERIKQEAASGDIIRKIVGSIAPSIYGLTMEKEALALQLFGGVAKKLPDGRRIRGDSHILLIGDPGTAKSELLTYIVKLSPRGIYTSGKAATPAGLVAAAVRDEFGEGRWTLEAGALVLGDRGLVAIDEIEKMSDQDRSSIHNAMEQQTVHIAKAGITATLQTRTSILAAANPTFGRFDSGKYISEQIQLPPTLLSRFDSIFPILDKPQAQVDRAMAEHILRGHLAGEKIRQAEAHPLEALPEEVDETFLPYFEPSFLRKYVAYAKRIYPVLTPEAMQVIQDKYLEIRKQGEGEAGTVPITPRQLEAFIRIAEASARARLSPKVEEVDAERSVHIVEYWLERVTGVEGGFDIDIVATGLSQSQRAQMIALREIIGELAERDGAADLKDLLEAAEERGVPPNRVEAWLKRWSQEGEVYSPAPNKWRLVSRF
ncbi:MAG: minichromosome maintenance protein MCM [Thermoplasmata archaeon]